MSDIQNVPVKPDPVTAHDLYAVMLDTGQRLDHHPCAICDHMTAYFVEAGALFFDSSCGCCCSRPTQRDVVDLQHWLDMNTGNGLADQLWQQLCPQEAAHGHKNNNTTPSITGES